MRVRELYFKMHEAQTVILYNKHCLNSKLKPFFLLNRVDFVKAKVDKWTKFDKTKMTIMEGLWKLNDIIDESDPDVDVILYNKHCLN